MSTAAFGETLQFITNVKLEVLEKRSQEYAAHSATVFADANVHGNTDLIARLNVLIDGMKAWPGAWSANIDLKDVKRWLEQAKRDPVFPRPILQEWVCQIEAQMGHEQTRYDFARLFGNLLTDWLSSKAPSKVATAEQHTTDAFEKVNRKETLEQKEKLESLIFEEKHVDVSALDAYLKDLFSSKEAEEALEEMRKRIKDFSKHLRKTSMTTDDVETVIDSALRTDVLSEEKQATLKEFKRNRTVMQELTSVLNMQREAIQSWQWPQEGVLLEPRRHLNGKTRFYLDTEILTCLLLHYIGMKWAVEFRQAFYEIRNSHAWKKPARALTHVDIRRRNAFLNNATVSRNMSKNVVSLRENYRSSHFFMCQLPSDFDAVDNYDDEPRHDCNKSSGPRFDTPVNLKQSLLHIIASDFVFNKALYGRGTVVRTDLEWFGPSLPHQTIRTILQFFGTPEEDVQFIQIFLSCPIVFKDDSSGLVRTRKRGVPISYVLSTLCGEVALFVMDFAVNQRAKGLFLYRIHDDFWFWDKTPDSCVAAWKEMTKYASLAGLTFNQEKTGSICIGAELPRELPQGDVRWGFLKMNEEGRFVIDQTMIDEHVAELRRQLKATTSVFGWTQAYNKYMAFVVRNCGEPAFVYGKAHIDGIIDTLARMQRTLFPEESGGTGGFVKVLAKMLETKFGARASEIPLGFYLWPNTLGGLEVKDPLVDLFLIRDGCKETAEEIVKRATREDEVHYTLDRQRWEDGEEGRLKAAGTWSEGVSASEPFMSFQEYIKAREERTTWWANAYEKLLQRPGQIEVTYTPELEASMKVLGPGIEAFGTESNAGWGSLPRYWQWIIGLHHHEMVRKFGSLAIVDPNAVPVGMVAVFKSSRMKWEQ